MSSSKATATFTSVSGDIFASDADAIVNAVNCIGVMGKGLALQFKKRFPENFKVYKSACDQQALRPGSVLVHEHSKTVKTRFVINFPTKDHWKQPSKIEYIDSGLESLVHEIQWYKISSIAIPALGCGLGGLDWESVRPRIVEALSPIIGLTVFVYEPRA